MDANRDFGLSGEVLRKVAKADLKTEIHNQISRLIVSLALVLILIGLADLGE